MEPVTPSVMRFPESSGTLVLERLDISFDYTSREIESHAITTYCPGAPEIREFWHARLVLTGY